MMEHIAMVGLRDRALIGVMVFTFGCVGAAIGMKVEDYFIQGRRGWVRLYEKGGKPFLTAAVRRFCSETCSGLGIKAPLT